jgi:hypothetical protein
MREKDNGKRLFYHKTELIVEFLDRGVTGSTQPYYGTLEGFRQANCLKTSDFLLQSFVIFMVKPGSIDNPPYSPDLAVRHFYFLDHLRSACLANDVC